MNSHSLTLKQLRYFVRVVDLGSITRAAEELHVAQTALGLQIRALEDGLGRLLLQRHSRGVTATEVGRYVAHRARQVLRDVDSLADEVDRFGVAGPRTVTLGLTPSLMQGIGARAILHEREHLPDIHLHLVEGLREQLVDGLTTGSFDYIFAHDVDTGGTLRAVPLLRQPLVLANKAGAGLPPGPVSFADALATDLAARGTASHTLELVEGMAAELGLVPNLVYEIESLTALKQLIRQCEATTILTSDLILDETARGELEVHEIVEPSLEMTLQFVMRTADPPTGPDLPLLAYLDRLIDEFFGEIGASDRRLGHLGNLSVAPLAS